MDYPRTTLHSRDFFRPDQFRRFFRLGRGNHHVIRFRQHAMQFAHWQNSFCQLTATFSRTRHPKLACQRPSLAVPVRGQSIRIRQSASTFRSAPSNAGAGPKCPVAPTGAFLVPQRIREIARQRDHQTHGVLRHRHGEYAPRIGQDTEFPQFAIHQLRNARGGRM